jgi:hypothetical protein
MAVLAEKAEEYGLDFVHMKDKNYFNYHPNYSYWDEAGNLLETSHPEYDTKGKAIIEGCTKATYECAPVLMNNSTLARKAHGTWSFDISKQSILRMADGRYEHRLNIEDKTQDPELSIALNMGGAVYGLRNAEHPDFIRAQLYTVPCVEKTDRYATIRNLIEFSILSESGNLGYSPFYLKEKILEVSYELGLEENIEVSPFSKYAWNWLEYRPFLVEFIDQIRIRDGKIIWPQTSPGKYEFVTPDVNMDLIPQEMQERIRAGNEISMDECSPYIPGGGAMPKLGEKYVIDVKALEENVKLKGLEKKYLIMDGYDLNATQEGQSYLAARKQRMFDSEFLDETVSGEFRRNLISNVAALPIKDAGRYTEGGR